MPIKVLYFASLRDTLKREQDVFSGDGVSTVRDVWERVSGDAFPADRVLCAINMEYATADSPVHDGDEVAFFPPVTGG